MKSCTPYSGDTKRGSFVLLSVVAVPVIVPAGVVVAPVSAGGIRVSVGAGEGGDDVLVGTAVCVAGTAVSVSDGSEDEVDVVELSGPAGTCWQATSKLISNQPSP
jgi:thiazole synthase ThiGH ThiG subunit